jgi:hypothetical protein
MIHGILVDGLIERVDGSPQEADQAVESRREAGHAAAYLFGAITEDECDALLRAEVRNLVTAFITDFRDVGNSASSRPAPRPRSAPGARPPGGGTPSYWRPPQSRRSRPGGSTDAYPIFASATWMSPRIFAEGF